MANLGVTFVINSVNKSMKGFSNVVSGFAEISARARQAGSAGMDFSNQIAAGMLKAEAAIATVQRAIGFIQGKLSSAMQVELENLSSASGLSDMLGGFDEAAAFVDKLNASLSQAAAALPGATAQYSALARAITDDVGLAFREASGKIEDMAGFEETLSSIATSYSAMAAAGGLDPGNMQMAVTRMLGGGSMGELYQLDSIQNNPQLKNALEEALRRANVESLADLDQARRIQLIREVGEAVMTPEFLARSQRTLDGIIQGFVSDLFDPQGGLFGVLRDLDAESEGQQNVYEAAKNVVRTLIGSDGIFFTIKKIIEASGMGIDPMQVIYDGLNSLNEFLTSIGKVLKDVNDIAQTGGIMAAIKMLLFYFGQEFGLQGLRVETIGETIAQFINSIFHSINAMLTGSSANLGKVGEIIAVIVAELADLFKEIDYSAVGMTLSHISRIILEAAGSFIINVIGDLDAGAYGAIALSSVALYLIPALTSTVKVFAGKIVASMGLASAGVPAILVVGVIAAVYMLVKVIMENWEQISQMATQFFADMWNSFTETWQGMWDVVVGIVTGDYERVASGAQGLIGVITGFLSKLRDMIATLFPFLNISTTGQASANQAMANATMAESDARYARALAANGGSASIPLERLTGAAATPQDENDRAAGGFLPNTRLGRMIGAILAESNAAPPGSSVIAANSSEAVLNAGQQSALAGAFGSGGVVLQPTFNINGAQDPQQTAMQVVELIEAMLNQRLSNQIA